MKHVKKVGVTALLLSGLLSGQAYAAYPVYVDGLIVGMSPTRPMFTHDQSLDTDLSRWINGTEGVANSGIIGALQALQQQSVANTTQLAKMQGNYATTNDARRVVGNIQAATLQRAGQVMSGASVCNVVTGNITGSTMAATTAAWREQQIQQDLNDYLGGNKQSTNYKGTEQANKIRVSMHCQFAATQSDVDIGLCPKVTSDTAKATGNVAGGLATNLAGSDLDFSTVFEPKNGVYSSDGVHAASLWKRHAFADTALGPMSAGAANSPEEMASIAAGRFTKASQFSLADDVFANILSERSAFNKDFSNSSTANVGTYSDGSPSSDNATATIQQWAEGTAKQVIGYNQSGNNFPDGVSQEAYLALRAKAWYWNPNWAVAVGGNSGDQNSKDIALMMSYSVYQNYLLYEKTEMTNALLAMILHNMQKQNTSSD